ncbi:hypothetical protein AAFN88_06465 [Pelagibius sp. CAU 1746]|uniref:hypothetical protein n=1 Tax=Pelagibius sp. CAU 1746 TaxID=3140370 RepID=UPI00325BE275
MNQPEEDTQTRPHDVSNVERICLGISVVVFLATMLVLAVLFPEVTAFQEFVFRTVVALTAGAAAAFIPGFFHLRIGQGKLLAVRATGAIAVTAFVYYVNPPSSVSERKVFMHEGLVHNLESHIAAGTGFSLELDPSRITELRALFIEHTAGESWGELFSKICRRYPNCLVCDPPPGSISDSVMLSLVGPPLVNLPGSTSGNVKQCPST